MPKNQKDDNEFFLGNRAMPVWAVAISIIASSLSAVTFLGAPQEAFKGDLSYLVLNIGGIIAIVFVAYYFIPIFYQSQTLTIYGYLEKRFGGQVRPAAAIVFLFGRLLASGARLFAAALGASLLIHGNVYPNKAELIMTILLVGIAGTLYTLMGGIRAVIWTDVLQFFVVAGSALVSIVLLCQAIPLSFGEMFDVLTNSSAADGHSKLAVVHTEFNLSSPYTLWTGAFAIIFMNLASYGVDYDLVQRILTCKSSWKGSLSLIVSNFLGIGVVIMFMGIGLLLYLFCDPAVMGDKAAPFDRQQLVYPQFLVHYLPKGFSGLAMAGLFAVAMGSFDSAINAMACSILSDVVRPLKKWTGSANGDEFQQGVVGSRTAVALMGMALVAFAILAALAYDPKNDTLLGFALGVMAYAYAGLLGVFLTGIFTRRGNAISVYCALIGGAVTVLLIQPFVSTPWTGVQIAWPWWMVFGTAVSFLCCVAGKPVKGEAVVSMGLVE